MSQQHEQFTLGTDLTAKKTEKSKTSIISVQRNPGAVLRRAKIVSYSATSDTYTCKLVDNTGTGGTDISECIVWGTASFEVDQAVWIYVEDQIPMILASGGSGGSLVNHDHSSINSGGLVGWLS